VTFSILVFIVIDLQTASFVARTDRFSSTKECAKIRPSPKIKKRFSFYYAIRSTLLRESPFKPCGYPCARRGYLSAGCGFVFARREQRLIQEENKFTPYHARFSSLNSRSLHHASDTSINDCHPLKPKPMSAKIQTRINQVSIASTNKHCEYIVLLVYRFLPTIPPPHFFYS
ncbi:hypothetical protein, partial [Bacteroides heparinolyticus]|uniref:hypothetical protein n=4 Tax=Prevotella heparinolytica TaxID=28113 RepID=UPI0035A0FA0A